jgi:hypothetical protein
LSVRVPGQHHLPAVGGCQQPASPVEDRSEVVTGAGLDLTHVDRHPHAYGGLAPVDGGERPLDLLGNHRSCPHLREGDVDSVADALDDFATLPLDGLEHDPVVLGHRRAHRRRV